MDYNNILVEISDQSCYITINRPKQLNSLNIETIRELNTAILNSENNLEEELYSLLDNVKNQN